MDRSALAVPFNGAAPSSLSAPDLARRLAELCGEERCVQVEFLLHLDVFDRGWAEAGYGSLWAYCLEFLHLRESSAGRRIAVMKILRRFPSLAAPLREGRLSLSTVDELGEVLTEANVAELAGRAAFLSVAETRRLVASIQPQPASADGVRRVGPPAQRAGSSPLDLASGGPEGTGAVASAHAALAFGEATTPGNVPAAGEVAGAPAAALRASRPELRPVTGDTYSLRVTLDAETNAELQRLVSLLSHRTNGDLAAVVKEAIRCALEKHGKRKGAVAPARPRAAKDGFESLDARGISMDVRRVVWEPTAGAARGPPRAGSAAGAPGSSSSGT